MPKKQTAVALRIVADSGKNRLITLRSKTKFNIKLSPQAKRYRIESKNVLAKFFRVAKLCESAGFGFDKMLQWKKQTGNEVLFETSIDKTKFTFMLDAARANQKSGTEGGMKSGTIKTKSGTKPKESGMKSGTIESKSGTNPKESGTKSGTIESKSGMNPKESGIKSGTIESKSGTKFKTIDKILDLIRKDNTISITQLSTATNITRSTIQKHVNNLKIKGIIRRDGAGKGGKWTVIKPD
jgi:predicted HTH transcriptional regulator